MALTAARPFTHEVVHSMSPAQLIKSFRCVLDDEVDNLGKRTVVHMLLPQPLHVTRERRTELGLKPTHWFKPCMQHREGPGRWRKNCQSHPLP